MTIAVDRQSPAAVLEGVGAARHGAVLRSYWHDTQGAAFESGAEGHEIARHLSVTMDDIIRALCEFGDHGSVAVLAVGGYGQGRLAPFSDIDLLILRPDRVRDSGPPTFIYPLWDMGMTLSPAIHTVSTAMTAVKQETDTCTSFLDARLLWGDEKLAETFSKKFEGYRAKSRQAFLKAKLAEQSERHAEADNSRYALEPDVKSGRGGLRDLQTLHWLNRYCRAAPPAPRGGMQFTDIVSPAEERRLHLLEEFFWSVRVMVHRELGRADDKLYFTTQKKIASDLGFRPSGRVSSLARFMRYYFMASQEVGRIGGAAIARLEMDFEPGRRRRAAAPVKDYPGLLLEDGRLKFADTDGPPSPEAMMEIFHASAILGAELHADAFTAVSRAARRLSFRELHTREVADRLIDIFRKATALEPILREMEEAGLLGRLLPSFGAIVGKAEYGLFRRFTLDDHVLRSVGVLDRLCRGEDPELSPADGEAISVYKAELAMALLLQEMAAGMARPTPTRIRRRIVDRAGYLFGDRRPAELVAFAVLNRKLLGKTATRRNVADPAALSHVAKEIGTEERLDFLARFTLCRQHEAGVGSWEEFRLRPIGLLVELLRLQISGGRSAVKAYLAEWSHGLRDQVAEAVGAERIGAFDALMEVAGPGFWSATDIESATRLAKLMADVGDQRQGDAAVHIDDSGLLHVLVYTEDRPTLFAECAGLAAMSGASVYGARGYAFDFGQHRHGVVLLELKRASTPPEPFRMTAAELETVQERYRTLARGNVPTITLPAPAIGDRRHVFKVEPSIRMDREASEGALIVEVEALDRPGLLYLLASHLSEIGVEIVYALVATFGHRAVDTFYLRDYPGYKIEDERRIEAIRRQIIRALTEGGESHEVFVRTRNA